MSLEIAIAGDCGHVKNFKSPLSFGVVRIIPVPAKPIYSFNNVEIITYEFEKIFKIPIDCGIIARSSDSEKSYEIINSSIQLNNANVLLIDDIFTRGTTRANIWSKLRILGCTDLFVITIGKTDHNIYEYTE